MYTTLIAIYSGLVSTLLAILKFKETWENRFRIFTLLTSGIDNQIHITNLYTKSVTIINYDLFWAKNKKSEDGYKSINTGSEECCNIVVAANETKVLTFSDQYSFSLNKNKGNLYIRLYLADRKRPVTNLLYPWKD
ncbi:hypothetical protein [Mucilaginibacter sp. UYCu711]|uniref:hypothetical protein n=1 Tax=Mucilaginibacter sp. UYCu711 TaxID=3156339 RepID=UPI003D1AC6DA